MFQRIRNLFRGSGVIVRGAARLPEGESKTIALGDPLAGGKELVLCRKNGKLWALDRICPHEGGRILDGPLVDGEHVVCPLHNYRFDPTTGKAVGVACPSARTYPVVEEGDDCRIKV